MKNTLIAILALIAAGACALAWKERQELAELRAGAMTAEERTDLQKRIWASERHVKDLEQQLAGPARRAAGSDAGPNRGPGGSNGLAANILSRMSDPEAQKLIAQQVRTQIERRYADLFAKLNLPADKLEQLKSLLVDRQTAGMDVLSAANEQGITDPQEFQKLLQSTQDDINNQIKGVIGDSGYGQLQQFQQGQAVRGLVGQLRGSLSAGETPLTSAQAAQMNDIIAQTQPSAGAVPAEGNGQPPVVITDQTIARAQGVLSAAQIQALQQIQQQQQTQQRLRQIMMRGGDNQAPPPGGG